MNLEDVFLAALDQPDAKTRNQYLERACNGDSAVRRQVDELLAAHFRSGEFLNVPAIEQVRPNPDEANTVTVHGESSTSREHDTEELGFLEPATRPDSLGRIGHYEVLQVLGKGGFGIVFRAFDEVLHRVVAVKVLAPHLASTSPARKRFIREARTSAAVRHENVVQVYEVGEQPLPYIVMEFIPGETLQQWLDRNGPVSVADVLRIGRQLAEGLAAAHATDLIHRDIKPANVLLEGGAQRVKITDFGLARAADDASISQSGIIAGTPMYMAPEQAKGETLDQRADLFSLGSVLYVMAAGRSPFRATGTLAVLKRVAEDTPRPIREIIPETPQWLCDIIAKLHAKNPDDRYQSARDVADVLADCEAQLKANAKLKDFSRIPRSKQPVGGKSGFWKWALAAALLLPVVTLALAELGGVTHLFHGKQTVPVPNTIDTVPTPLNDGFVQLFNGKDLTGWKTHPDQPGNWKVDGGILVGSTIPSYLFSNGGEFENFHLRVEAKISRGGDSGIFFRSPFSMRPGRTADQARPAAGYEVEIEANPNNLLKTGSVWDAETAGPPKDLWRTKEVSLTKADEWFTLEIIAQGNRIISKVNGTQTADCIDPLSKYKLGHFALQIYSPQTMVQFRKIEIKELPQPTAVVPFDATKAKEFQDAWAKHIGVPVDVTNFLGMKLRFIPPGEFKMGTPPNELAAILEVASDSGVMRQELPQIAKEGVQRDVRLTRPYYVGVYEVTYSQFEQFVKATGYKTKVEAKGNGGWSHFQGNWVSRPEHVWRTPGEWVPNPDEPVVHITAPDAEAFCAWLSKVEGVIYSLLTEAQWEFACRAGTSDATYATSGQTLADLAWTDNATRYRKPAPQVVGQKRPNAFGLYDMLGNVWEYVADKYSDGQTNSELQIDPTGPPRGTTRLIRGGAWYRSGYVFARSSARSGYELPDSSDAGVGFRVAITGDLRKVLKVELNQNEALPLSIAPFTDADVQRIAALPAAEQVEEVRKELKKRNPDFGSIHARMTHKIEGDVVTEISIVGVAADIVTDISPVRALVGLKSFACGSGNQLSDISPLKDMKLTSLKLTTTRMADLSLLKGITTLTTLDLWGSSLTDLMPLKDNRTLTTLNLSSTPVTDLSPLKGMKLTSLSIGRTGVTDLSPLKDMKLTSLRFIESPVTDLSPLKDMKLTSLNFHNTPVSDLSPLKGMPLAELNCKSTKVTDLSPLKDVPLTNIECDFQPERDADNLRAIKTLETINGKPAAEFWKEVDKK